MHPLLRDIRGLASSPSCSGLTDCSESMCENLYPSNNLGVFPNSFCVFLGDEEEAHMDLYPGYF